jgi:DNA-binding MarR family transcriptional regulator
MFRVSGAFDKRLGMTEGVKPISKKSARGAAIAPAVFYQPPLTISREPLLDKNGDGHFRETLYLLVLALGRLLACRDAFGRAVNLTGSQFAVLIGVAYTQETRGVTIGGLAAHIQLASTHVTTEVGRLCRLGLLTKVVNPDDGRSVLVCLTPRGEHGVEQLAPFMRSVNDVLFETVTRREFEELFRFFERFAKRSEAALELIREREAGL